MQFTIDWIHLTYIVGAVQGFLLAGVLVAHRSNRTANRLLAVLMATFTVYLIQTVYYSAGLVRPYPHFFGFSYPLPWVFGPLVYLYAVAASDGSRGLEVRDALHFVLPTAVVIATLPIYLMSGPDKIALFDRLEVGDVPTLLRVIDPTKYVSGFAYSVATLVHLRRHRRSIENSYSTTDQVNLRWLLWLAGAAAGIWFLAVLIDIADLIRLPILRRGNLVSLAIALLVYAIGYKGLRQPEIFHYDDRRELSEPVASSPWKRITAEFRVQSKQPDTPTERYERSGLGEAEAMALKAALLTLMAKERPYRDAELTLPDLAERLDTTPHKLSEVLNAELSQTFYDFINRYRVEDVRRRLAESRSKSLNVLTLAMDAGFASKSTFNQVFKKQTGQTPSAYRQAVAG